MTDREPPNEPRADEGEVVRASRTRISVAWIFPILAVAAAAWLFWSHWRAEGPEITIEFADAPGLQAGKTVLIYRGVTAGIVRAIELDPNLEGVVVTVLLKAFASDLAREETVFWIDQPEISLVELSGLESIIQGNSLQARMGGGAKATHFVGKSMKPVDLRDAPSVVLKLRPHEMPRIVRGAPVFHRGVAVGAVSEAMLDDDGEPLLQIVVDEPHGALVRKDTRFWIMPLASLKTGSGGLKVDVPSLAALLQGGLAFETYGDGGEAAVDEDEFPLFETEAAARATSPPIRITFDGGLGLIAGQTELRYLDMTIGLVESAKLNFETSTVDVMARFRPGYEQFQREGAEFTVVQARISPEGFTGLNTLLTGIYIACEPGKGDAMPGKFVGRTTGESWIDLPLAREGLSITLAAPQISSLAKGAPVLHRGLIVGRVIEKRLAADGSPLLKVVVRREFASLVRENSRFWSVDAVSVGLGPGGVQVAIVGFQTLLQGALEFDAFGESAGAAADGAAFSLYETEAAARAVSPPIRISFANGQGLVAGRTQLRFRGLPVGLVESVTVEEDGVRVVARFEAGYAMLRRQGSVFSLVRPEVSLEGVTGLETLVSGVYIECVPGTGAEPAEEFVAQSTEVAEEAIEEIQVAEAGGLEIVLVARTSKIGTNAPVLYRGVPVGKVVRKELSPEAGRVDLVIEIDPRYAPLVRTNTRFWDVGGLKASLGFLYLKVDPAPLTTLTLGGIAFATPDDDDLGERVASGSRFLLHEKPKEAWLKWTPSLPVGAASAMDK